MKTLAWLLAILGVGAFSWNYYNFVNPPQPCQKPITYNIGTLDRRFSLSQEDFLKAISEAESIWEDEVDRELFAYDPEQGELLVNLIYDYRQEVTNTLSDIENVVEVNRANYDALGLKLSKLRGEYESMKSIYEARVESFNQSNKAYEKLVAEWNRGPRTSKQQFDTLEKARLALETEASEIQKLETTLNEKVREVNTLVNTLNSLAKSLNLGVEAYNTIGASRGESFTGGLFYDLEDKYGIDIYEFDTREKLVRVLTHELGHALGLEHVSDPKAIMYYLNEGEAGVLTEADISALHTLCGLGV